MPARETTALRSWLSSSDAITLLEISHACLSCRNESEFRQVFLRIRELVPFDHGYAGSGYCDARRGIVMPSTINVSFSEEFVREYCARQYLMVDPVLKDALATCRPQHCSERMRGRPKEIRALCMDFGLADGYIHGARSLAWESGSLFFFKSPRLKRDRRAAAILDFLGPHLHLAYTRVTDRNGASAGGVTLTTREDEVLQWLNRGKSSWETSVILGISERTVNFHVYNLLSKLGAVNRPQALAIATRLGLLA